ncbi:MULTISPECIES: nucleoside deaminase [unclassified Candidatus Tisiphia]|uniref:nucleoside deaminase n=1 Tax=unclassified Candidatus Tisiphia TaxID=2996318 RepID=UPI001E718797|nr:MAG: nucleoside deaminase [Rickettsia endosymbiont of Cimex lectularius]
MEEALKQAQLAFNENEIPVGAIIVNRISNKVISKAHNIVEQTKNPLLHAEIIAINQSCQILSSKNLSDCDMYVTLEPCTMCAAAISFARIGRLFYAANDPKQGGVENGGRFFNSKSCFYHPEIYSGFSAKISENLMKEFFKKVRSLE